MCHHNLPQYIFVFCFFVNVFFFFTFFGKIFNFMIGQYGYQELRNISNSIEQNKITEINEIVYNYICNEICGVGGF